MQNHASTLAAEFKLDAARVAATVALIDEGNTIPFIARYRKEATGSMDDQTLRALDERLSYLRKLDDQVELPAEQDRWQEYLRRKTAWLDANPGAWTAEAESALAKAELASDRLATLGGAAPFTLGLYRRQITRTKTQWSAG